MANNVLQIKRTSVSGRAANTTTLTNPGELALNMTDGIMYSTNGSVVFQIGANLTSIAVGNTTARFTANTLGAYHTGTVNAASLTVGTSFTANATLVNAAAINIVGQVNTATLYATTSANIASAVQANSTGIFTTGTANAATVSVGTSFVANTTQVTAAVPVRLNNQQQLRFQTVNSTAYAYMVQQNDDNFVFYTSNTTYGQRAVWSIFANTNTSVLDIAAPLRLSNSLVANGTAGTSGQVLKTNGTTAYWDTAGGTVTSVATANGLSGGPITTTGTLGVVTGSTLTVNSTGIHVNSALSIDQVFTSNNGAGTNVRIGDDAWFGDVNVADTVRIMGQQSANNGYIVFGNADNSIKLGRAGAGPLTWNGDFTTTGSSNATTLSVGSSFVANSTRVVIGTTVGLQANGGIGTAGQVLHSNGTSVYWAADDDTNTTYDLVAVANTAVNAGLLRLTDSSSSNDTVTFTGAGTSNVSSNATHIIINSADQFVGTVTSVATANGLSGGTITSSGTLGVTTGSTLTVNTTGIHVNSALSIASLALSGDLTVTGNLTVSGTRTYVNTTTLDIGDNIFTLNADLGAVAPSQDAGIEIMRGTSANVQFIWDETNDRWSTNSQPLAVSSLVAAGALSGVTTAALGNTTITGFANVTSTLQAGGVATFAANANFDSGVLFVDGTNNRVGVNTTTPGEALDVTGNIRASQSVTIGTGGTYAAGSIYSNADWGMIFRAKQASPGQSEFLWTNSVDTHLMRLFSNGNLGIANSAPAHRLSVGGTVAAGNTTITGFANVSTSLQVGTNTATFGTAAYVVANGNIGVGTSTPQQKFVVSNAGAGGIEIIPTGIIQSYNRGTSAYQDLIYDASTHAFRIGVTEAVRIAANGNVGIGTSTPGAELETFNSVGSTQAIRMNTNFAGGNYIDINPFISGVSNGGYSISANGSIRMVIDTSGNMGIGTTAPGYKLEVNGSFAATTKSFVIPHPTKPGMNLRYGSLEGPENGVYVRGRLRAGEKIIKLPDYWEGLVDQDTYTVNLTPVGKHQELYVDHIASDHIIVGGEDIDCFYTVFAERNDVDKLEVEF